MAAQSATNNQKLGYACAAVYAAIGLLGFTVTGNIDFSASEGGKLFGILALNPFTNGLHLLGALLFLIGASSGYVGARGVNIALGLIFLTWAILGFMFGSNASNIFGANPATNIFHLATGAILLAVGNKKDYPAPVAH